MPRVDPVGSPEGVLAKLRVEQVVAEPGLTIDELQDLLFIKQLRIVEDQEVNRGSTAKKVTVTTSHENPYGDGSGGAFDFSRQGSFLRTSLQTAVPLWIAEFTEMQQRDPDSFWDHVQRVSHDAGQFLAVHGDALMFRVKGTTAQAFNHLAKGIACMAFAPGGVTAFGDHWEQPEQPVDG